MLLQARLGWKNMISLERKQSKKYIQMQTRYNEGFDSTLN
jgi:hypothetical protein